MSQQPHKMTTRSPRAASEYHPVRRERKNSDPKSPLVNAETRQKRPFVRKKPNLRATSAENTSKVLSRSAGTLAGSIQSHQNSTRLKCKGGKSARLTANFQSWPRMSTSSSMERQRSSTESRSGGSRRNSETSLNLVSLRSKASHPAPKSSELWRYILSIML